MCLQIYRQVSWYCTINFQLNIITIISCLTNHCLPCLLYLYIFFLYIYIQNDEELPLNDVYNWADALVLVFAITDRRSFNYVRRVKQTMLDTFEMPVALVANKADMVHLRQVSTEEGTYINSTKCVQWNKLYLLFLYCVLNIVKHIF